ncbi:alpha-ketoglutarate-dependent dioxygenase AlkB [Picosynechococcus sp. PCC 7117]|uniref:alpha-ketoglutarate-dependent dioxygenase AlkB family protein n=1 Tax=Picosynechococcus sp. PCC 7117 TaxID=195498 RepID=UPI0008108DE1|nr:alpha-ketoglutarate-dependent dioxygenase AlkB [Picosynechococcus sp. PCC 7117]ANV88925.1 2OG-Fe(II) oxygenase [Picosynechococcus sp. PCC 7117]
MNGQQLNIWNNLDPIKSSDSNPEKIISSDGEVLYYQNFFKLQESNAFLDQLLNNTNWKQEYIKIFGKQQAIPRLTAWYGDEGKDYKYSGILQHPEPWSDVLKIIKLKVESVVANTFNSVLLNLYRNGSDGVAWHSDDEPELGLNPVIASVSFGGIRKFSLKHKSNPKNKIDLELQHGSLLIMGGNTQHNWIHQVAKTKKKVSPRVNLTFRTIY